MLGEYPTEDDAQLAQLAAMQYYIEYGSEISEDGLNALLKSYIPGRVLQVHKPAKPLICPAGTHSGILLCTREPTWRCKFLYIKNHPAVTHSSFPRPDPICKYGPVLRVFLPRVTVIKLDRTHTHTHTQQNKRTVVLPWKTCSVPQSRCPSTAAQQRGEHPQMEKADREITQQTVRRTRRRQEQTTSRQGRCTIPLNPVSSFLSSSDVDFTLSRDIPQGRASPPHRACNVLYPIFSRFSGQTGAGLHRQDALGHGVLALL